MPSPFDSNIMNICFQIYSVFSFININFLIIPSYFETCWNTRSFLSFVFLIHSSFLTSFYTLDKQTQ